MEKIHPLRENETLKSSLHDHISDQLLDELIDVKDWIKKQQEDGFMVAQVSLSGDLVTSSHVQYMNTIRAKIEKEFPNQPYKLLVGIEEDGVTIKRKNKTNIEYQEERKYKFENLKAVDKCYVTFEGLDEQTNDRRPAGIVKYLHPNIFVSHSEHIMDDEEIVRNNCLANGIENTIVINYGDTEKYLGEDNMRDKFNRSTTNTIRQVFDMYYENPKYNRFISSDKDV